MSLLIVKYFVSLYPRDSLAAVAKVFSVLDHPILLLPSPTYTPRARIRPLQYHPLRPSYSRADYYLWTHPLPYPFITHFSEILGISTNAKQYAQQHSQHITVKEVSAYNNHFASQDNAFPLASLYTNPVHLCRHPLSTPAPSSSLTYAPDGKFVCKDRISSLLTCGSSTLAAFQDFKTYRIVTEIFPSFLILC
jgi:hypothetical protein